MNDEHFAIPDDESADELVMLCSKFIQCMTRETEQTGIATALFSKIEQLVRYRVKHGEKLPNPKRFMTKKQWQTNNQIPYLQMVAWAESVKRTIENSKSDVLTDHR